MSTGLLAPLFLGPTVFLFGALLFIIVILVIARVVFAIAWRIIVIAAVVLGLLWLVGVIGSGPSSLLISQIT
ncbi:MAG: hypothetical protein ACOC42_04285 [Halobacteriota archaeon]